MNDTTTPAPQSDDARANHQALALCREALDMLVPGGDLTYFTDAHAQALRVAVDAFDTPAVAWLVHRIGCDGSADWVHIGEDEPDICVTEVAVPLTFHGGNLSAPEKRGWQKC